MVNLFIDTNILLSFYHYSSDDLEELSKLAALIEQGEITLWVPDQLVDEFKRNRDNKIADALRTFKSENLNLKFPQMSKAYTEFDQLREHQKEFEKLHSTLLQKITKDALDENLPADIIIARLFQSGKKIGASRRLLANARKRVDVGNPPGKLGSLGDAICWECLLSAADETDDICFISEDKDYRSKIDNSSFNPFLLDEWETRFFGELTFYRRLSEFLKDHYPTITLASEVEKDLLIQKLARSGSFDRTHKTVAKLLKYDQFSLPQAQSMAIAATTNTQVGWILTDLDVFELYETALKLHPQLLEDDDFQEFSESWAQTYESKSVDEVDEVDD